MVHPLPDLPEALKVAAQVRQVLREIRDMTPVTVEMTGDICYTPAAKVLERLMDDPQTRFWALIALSEYLCSALDGCPLDIEKWQPLLRFRYPQKVASFQS